jgi:hypothetical protein
VLAAFLKSSVVTKEHEGLQMKRKVFFYLQRSVNLLRYLQYSPVKINKISEARTGLIRVRTGTGRGLLLLR